MGILEWIKRELDTSLLVNRRHSEPPILYFQYHTRDEAYIKALNNFNAWRLEQKDQIHLNIISEEMNTNGNNKRTEQKQVKFEGDNIYEEIISNGTAGMSLNPPSNSKTKSTTKKKITPPKSSPKRDRKGSRCFKRRDKSSNSVQNTDDNKNNNSPTLYSSITKKIMKDDKIKNPQSSSPPSKFYKTSVNPFRNMRTPKILKSKSDSNNVVDSSSKTKDKTKSPVKSDSGSSDFYRLADQANGLTVNNVTTTTPATPVTNYANFPSNSKTTVMIGNERSSPVEEVTNKYGDIVEYDLPYDNECNQYRCPTNNDAANLTNIRKFIDLSFDYLNKSSKQNNETTTTTALITPTRESLARVSTNPVTITDLDKTDSIAKVIDMSRSQESILNEFKALEAWSKTVEKSVNAPNENDNDNGDLADESYSNEMNTTCLAKCYPQNIKSRSWCIKNIPYSIFEYSGGKFRDNNVTLKNLANSSSAMRYGETGLWQDLHILRKVRHPDIATLMSVSMTNRQKLIGLVLEPFKCNINELIHNNDGFIPIKDCIDYTLQITQAAIYLQESGYIHSNISSYNVMLCEYKNCVKLTSFELATNAYDIRHKILSTYGLEDKNFKNIDDNIDYLKNFEQYPIQQSNEPTTSNPLTNNDSNTNSKNKTEYKIPRKYLPYSVKYRKLYAQHYYQPPELISCYTDFVYPLPQSDVYCITLMLWEMLNRCKPFGIFSDLEMEKLFCLKQAELPLFEMERCKIFKGFLSCGLKINPRNRLSNAHVLHVLMDMIKKRYNEDLDNINNNNDAQSPMDNSKLVDNPSALSDILPMPSETPRRSNDAAYRTSTLKKQPKSIRRNMRDIFNTSEYNSPERMANKDDDDYDHRVTGKHKADQDQIKESQRKVPENNVSQNVDDEFLIDMDDISLPNTPIARQSKLLKAAWLASCRGSSASQISDDQQLRFPTNMNNDANTSRKDTTTSGKRLQVTVKISHNQSALRETSSISQKPIIEQPAEETAEEVNLDTTNVPSQIDFWNSLSVPSINDISSAKIDKSRKVYRKSSNEMNNEAASIAQSKKITDIHERSIYANKDNQSDKGTKMKFIPESSRTEEASTSKTMSDEHFSHDISPIRKDFETSLWKKEKARCDSFDHRTPSPRLSGLRNPDRLSVKEAVNKFESFHKNNSASFNSSKILNIDNNSSPSVLINKSLFGLSTENTSVFQKNTINKESAVVSESLQNTEPNNTPDNKSDASGTINVENQSYYFDEGCQRQTTTMDAVSVLTTTTSITKTTSTTSIVTLNRTIAADSNSYGGGGCCDGGACGGDGGAISRPLSRRVSDIGTNCNDVVVLRTPNKFIRGEIIGDNNLNCKKINFHCWKCDAPCIILDNPNKVIRSNEHLNVNINRSRHSVPVCFRNIDGQPALTPFNLSNFGQRDEKSIEDLYIDDDDYSQGFNLAANMELGTDRSMLFSDVDFDMFSEQFLDAEETELGLDLEPKSNE